VGNYVVVASFLMKHNACKGDCTSKSGYVNIVTFVSV
jgi:hypothetical protein